MNALAMIERCAQHQRDEIAQEPTERLADAAPPSIDLPLPPDDQGLDGARVSEEGEAPGVGVSAMRDS